MSSANPPRAGRDRHAEGPRPDARGQAHPLARPFLWLDSPWTGLAVTILFGALAGGLMLLEFLLETVSGAKYEEVFGVYEVEALLALAAVIALGWPMRLLFGRRPDYYAPEGEDE